jgi:hypothetical protein
LDKEAHLTHEELFRYEGADLTLHECARELRAALSGGQQDG